MKRVVSVLLLAVFVAVVSGQAPVKPQSFLSVLKAGQSVHVKEVAGQFEIRTFDDSLTPLSHKVIEVGADFIVIEDITGVTETRIPIFSIKSLVRFKIPAK